MSTSPISFESLNPSQQSHLTETLFELDPPKVYKKPLSIALAALGLNKKADRNEFPVPTRYRGWANEDKTEFYSEARMSTNMLRSDCANSARISLQRFEAARGIAMFAEDEYSTLEISFRIESIDQAREDCELVDRALKSCIVGVAKSGMRSPTGDAMIASVWCAKKAAKDLIPNLRKFLRAPKFAIICSHHEKDLLAVNPIESIRSVVRVEMPKDPEKQALVEAIIDDYRILKTFNVPRKLRHRAKLFALETIDANKLVELDESLLDSVEIPSPAPSPCPDTPKVRPKSPLTLRPFVWFTEKFFPEGTDFSRIHASHWIRCPLSVP